MAIFSKKIIWLFTITSLLCLVLYSVLFINWRHPAESSVFLFRNGLPELLAFSQLDIAINYDAIYNQLIFDRWLFPEPLSSLSEEQLHPRSTTIIFDQISPIGFPGVVVLIAMLLRPLLIIFGSHSLNLLVVGFIPLIAVLTPWLLYAVLTPFFRWRIALFSALLLYVMPLWWYYANWPAQHHTLLIFFIVSFLYCSLQSARRHVATPWRVVFSLFAGISFALAIYMRPVEMWWLMGILLAMIIQQRKHIYFLHQLFPFLVGAILIAIAFFYTQSIFYGHALSSGYVIPQANGSGGSIVVERVMASPLIRALWPYGLNIVNIVTNAYHYLFRLVFPWAIFAGIGIVVTLKNRERLSFHRSAVYTWYFLGASLWLLLYYGSSSFFDSLMGHIPTVGTSYTRYFLPIYVFALPLVVRGIVTLRQFFPVQQRFIVTIVSFILLLVHSYHVVFTGPDGLSMLQKNIQQFYTERNNVLLHTPLDAIIVTDRSDKYIFPYRRVIVTAADEEQKALRAITMLLSKGYPLFWYTYVPEQSGLVTDWQARLVPLGLTLSAPVWSDFSMELRRIEKIPEVR